ncbi:MAG: M61 family metallopeptidase [Gemmatimonadaceae bacterium]|nr:M61 family metallopeptidase [Gemmatimonadaceae bacterium]
MRPLLCLSAIALLVPSAALVAATTHQQRTIARAHGRAPWSPSPIVSYRLRVDSADLTAFAVEIRIRNGGDTLRVAMAAHPEYDDRYWRYLRDLRVSGSDGGELVAVREDSIPLWRIVTRDGEALIRYRIVLPVPAESPRAAWRPFLSPTGGLVGGPHAFLYLVSATRVPSRVTLEVPPGWEVATGLPKSSAPNAWEASDAATLVDSPMLVGRFHSWRFVVNGVPHHIAYWPMPGAPAVDTVAFARGIERLAREAMALFRGAPYRDYTFIYQDGAYGGLEHRNSVTLGVQSDALARGDLADAFDATAHEFTHTWNLMAIRPAEYGDVSYRTQPPVPGLWFSEGLTLHYADLLLRRAGLPTYDTTAITHLERMIERYMNMPGNSHHSAETISRAEYNSGPGALGDYPASTHLVGELLGTVLDLTIRASTSNRRSMDDVMRLMLARFSGGRGFTGADIQRAVVEACGCDVRRLFERHVRGVAPIDFEQHLRLAGLRPTISWVPATTRERVPEMDMRIRAWVPPEGGRPRLYIIDPSSIWGRAGIHTGDELVTINGRTVQSWREARSMIAAAGDGDTISLEIARPGGSFRPTVVMAGYLRPVVHIERRPDATSAQRAVLAGWLAARHGQRSAN